MDGWGLLRQRDKEIVWRHVVLGEKWFAVGQNLRISKTRVGQIVEHIYRILGVQNDLELALLVGRNYAQVEADAVALRLEMPKSAPEDGRWASQGR